MMLRISDNDRFVLEINLFDKIDPKAGSSLTQIFMAIEENHLFILPNTGGPMKVKKFSREPGQLMRKRYVEAVKLKGREFEGIAIDLMGIQ
jgi:hypothetical protein